MAEPMLLEIEEVEKPRKSRAVTKANGDGPMLFGFTLEQIRELPTDKLQDVLKMQKEMRAEMREEDAKKAFLEAKAAFKANAPTVLRDKDNKQYNSKYTSIGNLVNTVNAALAQHGLDASWQYEQGDTTIKCTCTLTHTLGHKESNTLGGPPDVSGNKNPLQQIKSTTTYLRIATFEAVTGIATREGNLDDDGNGAAKKSVASGNVSEKQADNLLALLKNDKGLEKRVLVWVGKQDKSDAPETVSDIPAWLYDDVVANIEAAKQ